jgi:hypothetical protein
VSALRTRRVRIYRYAEAGGDGFASATYTFDTERWAAITVTAAREVAAGGAPAPTLDTVLDFALATDVRYNDLLIDGDARYFARGVIDQRAPDARLVRAERVPREVYETLVVVDAEDIEDGPIEDAYTDSVAES